MRKMEMKKEGGLFSATPDLWAFQNHYDATGDLQATQ